MHSYLPYIFIKNGRNSDVINTTLGTLHDVINNNTTRYFSSISQKLQKLVGIGNFFYNFRDEDDQLFVNWRVYSKVKNNQGRLPLFIALEQNVTWFDGGLCKVLKGNGAAIEYTDKLTGLEAFMLAAVGTKSHIETIYKLLQDHPAAINPYLQT